MVDRRVSVGVGCLVFRGDHLLMARRQGVHGTGSWSPPGGAMEFGESFAETARREVKEETGVDVAGAPAYMATTNDIFIEEQRHFVTVWMVAAWASGVPRIAAPYELDAVAWITPGRLPAPLFAPFARLLDSVAATEADCREPSVAVAARLRPFVAASGRPSGQRSPRPQAR